MRIKKQDDIKDCGLYVIQALHYDMFGRWLEIDELRRTAFISSAGMNIKSLIELGKNYGIDMEAYEVPFEPLLNDDKRSYVGVVLNEGENHYVIFNMNGDKIEVSDPAKGEYTLTREEFKNVYQGFLLTYEKREYLEQEYHGESVFTYLFKNPILLTWIIITALLAITFSFATGIFSKVILDDVLPGGLTDTLSVAVVTFIFVVIIRGINRFLNSFLTRKFNLIIETDLMNKYFLKMRTASLLEMHKLSKIDHIRRIATIPSVAEFISSSAILVFNEVVVFIIATSLLIYIDPSMFGIAFAFTAFIVVVTIGFKFSLKEKYDVLIESNFKYMQSQIEKIENINSLKNINEYLFSDYEFIERMVDYKNREKTMQGVLSIQNVIVEITQGIAPIVFMSIGVNSIFKNEMTIGTVMMFVSIFNSFVSPLVSLCDFFLTYQQNSKNLKLLKYVLDSKPEDINKVGVKDRKITSIQLKDVEFGYDKSLINIKDLKIDQSVYIEGKNGSGKSTLLNIINTNYIPKGEILFNEMDRTFFNLEDLRSRIYTGSAKNYLTSSTIYDYITLRNDKAIQKFENSIVKYEIPKLLKSVGLRLEGQIINNGENLSAGQRQIIQLLRLFAFDYDVVILDEAFENIDKNNFEHLSKTIKDTQNAIFIEVSHSKKYIAAKKGINIEKINQD